MDHSLIYVAGSVLALVIVWQQILLSRLRNRLEYERQESTKQKQRNDRLLNEYKEIRHLCAEFDRNRDAVLKALAAFRAEVTMAEG